jgi:hypothetical protein
MTPKEKAKELFDKYENYTNGWDFLKDAKQCALIAVEEIINLPINEWCQITETYEDTEYWLEVKQEINKLQC